MGMASIIPVKISWPRRTVVIVFLIAFAVFALTECISKEKTGGGPIQNLQGETFAGSASCAGCHKNIYDSHIQTAHYLTSREATAQTIKGSFEEGKNKFSYDYERMVAMEKRPGGFFQVEYDNGEEKKAGRFDIVVGSATKGQTYIYWVNNRLFELPITYFTAANRWTNSPGYPNRVIFNRPITSRCLECHSTFMKKISAAGKEPEEFDHNQIIYGVDCEKCHGPAARHVAFQTANPQEKKGMYIINPAKLSRQQNLDLCALCHGGRLQKTRPSFTFKAGDTLANYFAIDSTAHDAANIDVHGNQYGLLRASKCFRLSGTMTCSTCHDSHKREAGEPGIFSARCMNCHNSGHGSFCKIKLPVAELQKNCIDCHMPVKSSRAITVLFEGERVPTAASMRSHYITVYPDETRKFMEALKMKANK